MRWLRKGVVIRLCIYVPILAYLGYQAVQKWRAEHGTPVLEAPLTKEPDDTLDQSLDPYKRVIQMPDGSQQEIIELTEDQAEELLGHSVPDDRPAKAAD